MNKVAINICMQVFVWTWILNINRVNKSVIVRLYGQTMCNFIRNGQTIFQNLVPFCIALRSHQYLELSGLKLSYSNTCTVVSCGFNSQCPNVIWCSYFCVVIYLYMFFGESSVPIICPFFTWSICLLLRLKVVSIFSYMYIIKFVFGRVFSKTMACVLILL